MRTLKSGSGCGLHFMQKGSFFPIRMPLPHPHFLSWPVPLQYGQEISSVGMISIVPVPRQCTHVRGSVCFGIEKRGVASSITIVGYDFPNRELNKVWFTFLSTVMTYEIQLPDQDIFKICIGEDAVFFSTPSTLCLRELFYWHVQRSGIFSSLTIMLWYAFFLASSASSWTLISLHCVLLSS